MKHNFFLPAAILSIALSPALNAALSVQSGIGAEPIGSCRVNFDDLALGSQAGTSADGPSGSITVTTTGNAGVVVGTNNPLYAAPVLSGQNGAGFGPGGSNQPNGPDTTPYLQAGNVQGGGSVTLTFSSPQTFMGLLWGSVDGTLAITNRLEFFSGAVSVGVVTGEDVDAVIPNGSQDASGTARVFITSNVPFDRVVATSTGTNGITFEFDNVAFNCATGCVRTQGYWKNHASAWPVQNLTLGTVSYTNAQLLAILNTPVRGNGLVSLAYQLIAAKLNVAAGAFASADVISAINAADAMIGGAVIPTNSMPPNVTDALTNILDAYNNGRSGTAHCD